MELLDIVDEKGIPTGELVERQEAHSTGKRHRTTHLWIARRVSGKVELLLQKRAENKDSFPGCYDISSAGHIPAGMDFVPSALRELREELGIPASEEELIDCGMRTVYIRDVFYNKPYVDWQITKVFLLWKDVSQEELTLQKEEVESVRWMDFHSLKKAVRKQEIPNCIDMEELQLLEEHF